MAKFNPDFWEVTVSQASWDQFANEDRLHYLPPGEAARLHERAARAETIWPQVRQIMDDVLTAPQRQVVLLYFFEQLNQRQIAERLSISQQSVSERLYGKIRNGRAVGGALRKLRQACAAGDVRWP